jgi:GH15 family glucan-1,4-alpha-glucosidase
VGDCRSVALVGVDGSIDWCCLPRFDSPSVFGRLLDARRGGAWELAPVAPYTSRQQYADKTNILRTIFQTPDGLAAVTDFMPTDDHDVRQHARPHQHPRLVRLITGLAGRVRFRQRIDPRPDYGLRANPLEASDGILHGSDHRYHYCFSASVALKAGDQELTVRPGETIAVSLAVNRLGRCGRPLNDIEKARALLRTTQEFWWKWINACTYQGPYQDFVWRSALALKLLTYAPTGAIVAAPTTSLPEWIGGPRNWDYRFTWLRDASFTLYALFQLGFQQEATDFMDWICHLAFERGLKNLYTLDGRSGPPERELSHLEGYRRSKPVRIGNGAADQLQLDVYGELLDSAYLYAIHAGGISKDLWRELRRVVDLAAANWEQRDASVWEVRGEYRDFTYSKAMCWAALDRGLRIARRRRLPADLAAWRAARRRIQRAVMQRGYSPRLESFTQAFDSDQLDAASLRLVQLGFLPDGDRRLRSTIDAVDAGLSSGPLVFRYRTRETDDGLDSPEGSFIICAFWLADALALVGELEQAQRRFERLLAFASPLGLFSEEVDPSTGALLGNFPQAFSHLSLISAAVNIERRRQRRLTRRRRA